MLLANHEDKEIIFDNHKTTVKRGQYLCSVRKLSSRWHWGKTKTLNFLRLLEEFERIERKADSRRTLITIIKYDVYQNSDTDYETVTRQSRDSHETVTRQSPSTNKNIKNDKNDKNNTPYNPPRYYPNDEALDKVFKDYVTMRKQIKKPLATDRAIELAIKKLDKLSGGDNDKAIEILNQSILNSWQGLFPLKDENTSKGIDWSKV